MAAPAGSSTAPGAPASAGDNSFNELLAAPGKGGMNLAALATRGRELQRSLDQMATALQINAHNITWKDTLDRFKLLQVQYQQLALQLRPLAKHYVAHPKVVDQNLARVLPIMLATKLLPDMEAERAGQLEAHRDSSGGASVEAQYNDLLTASERFNAGIEGLTGNGGLLDAAGPRRREISAAGRPQGAVAGGAANLRRATGKAPTRKRKSPEEEALLAAVLTGEGLRR